MTKEQQNLTNRLKHIEVILKSYENNTEQLKVVVDELKEVVQELDKSMAIHSEKQSHLFYRIEQLQKEIEVLEQSGEKTDSRQRDLVEKALMALLGGLITYVFSLINQ